MAERMEQVLIRMPKDMHDALKQLAESEDRMTS
jgi:predicted DNA-binding protein